MSSIFHGVGTLTPKQILALPEHCPHCVVGIWKHTFIFTVRPTVHTNPLRKQRTLFQAEKFENGALRKGWRHNNHMISNFPDGDLLKLKSKMAGDCCVLKLSRVVWTEHIRRVFKVKPFSYSSRVVWTACTFASDYHDCTTAEILVSNSFIESTDRSLALSDFESQILK